MCVEVVYTCCFGAYNPRVRVLEQEDPCKLRMSVDAIICLVLP